MDGKMLDGLGTTLIILGCVFPLGLWKLGEIIYWVCKHLHWS